MALNTGKAGNLGFNWRQLFRHPLVRAFAALAVVFILGNIYHAHGAFRRWDTHRDMLRQVSVYGILACGMTLVIVTGGIDLAVGSILALAAVLFSLTTLHWSWPAWWSVPATLLVGACAGGVSGGLVSRFRIQPFIATLAMMVFARGLAKTVSGGMKISTAVPDGAGGFRYTEVPAIFRAIDSRVLGGNLSTVTVIFAACAAISWLLLARHRWGRQLYAIGGNEEAARLSGVPVRAAKLGAYVAAGALAAVAGICQAA